MHIDKSHNYDQRQQKPFRHQQKGKGKASYNMPAKAIPKITMGSQFVGAWPAVLQTSRRKQKAILHDMSSHPLADLCCEQWECVLNPEFNSLSLRLGQGKHDLHYWAKKFGMLGHTHCLAVQLPKSQVLLYRPVCVRADGDYICFQYLNRVHSLTEVDNVG